MAPPVALTIAGLDPSAGAGLQADLKTFHQFGVYGLSVATLLAVQNTQGLLSVTPFPPQQVRDQLEAVIADIPPQAVKTGALGTAETVAVVVKSLEDFSGPVVVDPVGHGGLDVQAQGPPLLEPQARAALLQDLLPRTFLLTPNIPEAAQLARLDILNEKDMEEAGRRLLRLGPAHVLIKGGHREGEALDLLCSPGQTQRFTAPRVKTSQGHGTGCTLAAAVTAGLALGRPLPEAVGAAKNYVTRALQQAPGLGQGRGPLNHQVPAD